jgi:hypothetical protein
MPNTTKDIQPAEREDYLFSHPVAAAQRIYQGALVGSTLIANVANARAYAANDVVLGVSQQSVDNTTGANGARTLLVKRGCFKFPQNGTTITDTQLGLYAKPFDDQSVVLDGTGVISAASCGRIVAVDSDGVWIELRKYMA